MTRHITGQRFGRLTVIETLGREVICTCDCGIVKRYLKLNIMAGHTKSCGCYRNDRIKAVCQTHGQKGGEGATRTYRIWAAMKSRCDNKERDNYKWYGGRGITYCPAWSNFQAFFNDMGACPDGLELDRIDNNKGYYKENCRWISHAENTKNRGY